MFWDTLYAAGSIIFASVGGSAVVLALSGWLGKVWANRILEQDRQRYAAELEQIKATYQHEVQEKLEQLKDNIERGQFVHRLQFETEFKTYTVLWEKIVKVQRAAVQYLTFGDTDSLDEAGKQEKYRKLKEMEDAVSDFHICFLTNKPFLVPEVYAEFDALSKFVWEQGWFNLTPKGDDLANARRLKQTVDEIKRLSESACQSIRTRVGTISPKTTGQNAR